MKNLIKRIAAISVTASMLITGGITAPAYAEDIGSGHAVTVSGHADEQGMCGLMDYAYWNDNEGTIETNFKLGGAFDFTWNDVSAAMCMTGDLFVRSGKDKDLNNITMREEMHGNPVIDYRAKVETDENYTLGAYGWFDKERIEFSIIDDWGSLNPAEYSGDRIATIEVDGGTYDIYKKYMGTFDDPTPVTRISSIRREKRSTENGYVEGKISVYEHFKAWKKAGIKFSDVYELMLCAEGFDSSGTIHVIRNSVYYLFDSDINNDFTVGTGPEFTPPEDTTFPDTLNDTVFTQMASDERDGYYFNILFVDMLKNQGDFSLELLKGGNFKCAWDNQSQLTFERGLQYYNSENLTRSVVRNYDGEKITLDYAADIDTEGSVIAGAHGWLNNLAVEYFIVEGWKNWTVPEGSESLGAVGLNDGIYELYKGPENYWYSTIYSVRRENKLENDSHIEGTIKLADHLYAWEKYGVSPVDPDYVTFAITSYDGSGTADITKNEIRIDGVDIYQASTPQAAEPVETVGTTSAPATSAPATEAAAAEVPEFIPGDLNHDQSVDAFDVVVGRRELVKAINGEETMEEADLDCSGSTKINDLILVTKLAMGAEVNLSKVRSSRSK